MTLFYIANLLYLLQCSISDEATGKGVFQGPCEAHPITAGAYITGLSPLCSAHPKPPRHCLFLIAMLGC